MRFGKSILGVASTVMLGGTLLAAQAPAPTAAAPTTQEGQQQTPPPAAPAARFVIPPAYPVRAPGDPAKIAHGKQLFSVDCSFCHGSDARGGETGPNLVRSEVVLDDQNGELITPIVHGARVALGMPKFDLGDSDIQAIAAYLHSLPVTDRGAAPAAAINILVGNASEGEAYFNGAGKCNTCHSVTGDLAGIGSKFKSRQLQNLVVSGGGGRSILGEPPPGAKPTTVVVTLHSGQKFEGKLDHLDAFVVALTESDGTHRSFPINGDNPKVEVHDPFQPHIDMLLTFKDTDIHNLTSYLTTLK